MKDYIINVTVAEDKLLGKIQSTKFSVSSKHKIHVVKRKVQAVLEKKFEVFR